MECDIPIVLITGASGFIASHVVQQLLDTGEFRVRGTVRSTAKAQPTRDAFPKLELVEADLTRDEGWKEAVDGCKYVVHVASPLPSYVPRDENEVIRPAVDGTRRVLQACADAGTVQRVVLTSSVAAIADGTVNGQTYSESDWADPETQSPYAKSKTLAEKTAWSFVENLPEEQRFQLVAINPSLVLGPLITGSFSASLEVVKKLLQKSIPGVPRLQINIVDVRDVARAHVLALTSDKAAGSRFVLSTDSLWMKDVAQLVKDEFSPQGYSIPTRVIPKFIVWLASWFDAALSLVLPSIGKETFFENSKMREVLGIVPIPVRDSILDSCYSLVDKGHVVRKPGYRARDESEKQKAGTENVVDKTE